MIRNDIKESRDLVRFLDVLKSEFPNKSDREYKSLLQRAITRIGKQMDVKGEKWKRIGTTDYFISDHGNVRHSNSPQNQPKKGWISNGYHFVYFNSKSHPVHRLVAVAFHPCDNPEQMVVNHKNEIRSDNHVDNLEWMTHGDNIAYSMVKRKQYRNIYCYSEEGKLVHHFKGIKEAVNAGFVKTSVYKCLSIGTCQHKGFFFRTTKVKKEEIIEAFNTKMKNTNGKVKGDYNLKGIIESMMETGQRITINELATLIGVTRQTISNHITADLKDIIKEHNESL